MGLVLCHTADWHLGRTLHGASFDAAHRRFLAWLVSLIVEREVDVLVVAGDVFDRSVPSASAEAIFYSFLSELGRAAPGVQVVIVAGNHDGPARLVAPAPLLAQLGRAARLPVRIVGALPVLTDGHLDPAATLVPLTTRAGDRRGILVAVPFLRPSDLSRARVAGDAGAVERARAIHAELVEAAVRARAGDELLLATGHGHVRGARLSPDSERMLFGGVEAALPLDVFPHALDYVALGHLHLAQALDGGRVRYSGAPLPLAFSERAHPHQVVILREPAANRRGEGPLLAEAVRVPPLVELVRVDGERGASLSLEEARARLAALAPCASEERWVQVRVELEAPRAALKQELAAALPTDERTRLVSVEVVRGEDELAPTSVDSYEALAPEAVIARAWATVSRDPVPDAVKAALAEAWRAAQEEEDAARAAEPEVDTLEVAS